MARPIRIFDGSFGRLQLLESAQDEPPESSAALRILILHAGAEIDVLVDGEAQRLTRDNLLFLDPGVTTRTVLAAKSQAQVFAFQASTEWLRHGFPAVFDADGRPFASASEAITQRIRLLSDTLVVE